MSFYTIPATVSFSDRLAKYCETLSEEHACSLSEIKIFLPNRRSIRTLQEAFLSLSQGEPKILPIMQSIGDADLDEVMMHDVHHHGYGEAISPAIDKTHRVLVLARLLENSWPHDYSYVQALSIAEDLGRLIDQIHTSHLDVYNLNDIMSVNEFAQYWEITTSFLTMLLGEVWPGYLSDRKLIDPGLHTRLRIESLSGYYTDNPPKHPVVIAGSTGSIPATCQFIKTIGHSENGYVILPSLDMVMGDKEWMEVNPGHPQYLLKNLIGCCHVKRDDILVLDDGHYDSGRLTLMSEMMRPAVTTDQWKNLKEANRQNVILKGLNGLTLCEADNDFHEAMVIALLMLEIAADENQQETAILVTPDRCLAMRVKANLKQWGIDIDDSAGESLDQSSIGRFCFSVMDAYQEHQICPLPFLSMMKSPYIGSDIPNIRHRVRFLELDIFRGIRPYGDLDAIESQVKESNKEFVRQIKEKFEPLSRYQTGKHSVHHILKAHLQVMENLAQSDDTDGAQRLWIGDDGEMLAEMFKSLLSYSETIPDMTLDEYSAFIVRIASGYNVTATYGKHPRLSILGQIEARMVKADRVILSGLNESVWPSDSGFDAWMSRSMRTHFGLPSLEQKTTLSAHDFSCGFCSPDVFITRSKKSDGQPTLPSRWLERLKTVLQAADINEGQWPHQKGKIYEQWAHLLRQTNHKIQYQRPMPTPKRAYRPDSFSATEIEKWMRDPYWIYAKKILNLRKLDPVDAELSVADRGVFIHETVEQFTTLYPNHHMPEDATRTILDIGQDIFNRHHVNAEVHGLWWPRFTKTAQWFVDHEREWRKGTVDIHSEAQGHISVSCGDREWSIKAKADRIEKRKDGSYVVIDYKTGTPPSPKDVKDGIASQLVIEAMILGDGGFDNVSKEGDVSEMQYWVLNGADKGGSVKIAQGKAGDDVSSLIADAYTGLQSLFSHYDCDDTPYIASPDPSIKIPTAYNDYAHLERIAEWSVTGDEGESE